MKTMSEQHRDWSTLEHQYYQRTFNRQPVTLVRGEGIRVWDDTDKGYLDLVAGIAVNVLGHCHPRLIEAVQEQVQQIVHVSNLYYNVPQILLAEQLGILSGGMRVFLSNSGGEANEAAIKLARKYGRTQRNGAYEIISMTHGFHGRTLATTAATGNPAYHATWAPIPDGFRHVAFNDLIALKKATSEKTAGIIIEPIQGEGGIRPAHQDFLQGVREWCDKQNIVLIFDEVQTGMGRTGKFFCYEHFVRPDIVTLAKGLGGGVPIGAMLTTPKTDIFVPGEHGTTFGGNPLACAAALATIQTITEEDLISNAARNGTYLQQKLTELCAKYPDLIYSVRGMGLMQALHVQNGLAPRVVQRSLEQGLLLNNTDTETIRMVPPLIVAQADIDEAVQLLETSLLEAVSLGTQK